MLKKDTVKIDDKFGDWTVIGEPFKKGSNNTYHIPCRCVCGQEQDVWLYNLLSGKSNRCRKCIGFHKRLIKVGDKHGEWTVIGEERDEEGRLLWKCQCKCGKTLLIASCHLLGEGHRQCQECYYKSKRTGVEQSVWTNIKQGAKERNIPVDVTWEEAKSILVSQDYKCALTGVPLTFATWSGELCGETHTASLDRTDNDKPYVRGNLQWLHKWVNIAKKDHSMEEFIAMCHAVAAVNPLPVGAKIGPNFTIELPYQPVCSVPQQRPPVPSGSGFTLLALR